MQGFGIIFSLIAICLGATSSSVAGKDLTFYTEEWKPFNFKNEKGDVGGFTTVIVKKISANLGTNAEFALQPWSRALHSAEAKQNSAIYSIYRAPERENLFKWVGPVYTVDTVLWGLGSMSLPIKSLN